MVESIEKLLKQALVKRGADKAESAVRSLGKLARKKGTNREEVLGVLKTISAESPQTFARWHAFEEIGKTLNADDHEWLTFLRKSFNNHEAVESVVENLLRLFDHGAYQELVDVIADKKRPASTRFRCLVTLSEHSGRPFDQRMDAGEYEDITEEMYSIRELREWAAAGFLPPAPIVVPTKDLKKLGIELPGPYVKFLAKHRSDEEYHTEDGQWRLYATDELLADVNIDGKTVSAIKQLTRYAVTLEAVFDGRATMDDEGKAYPFQRLAAGWSIGTESSGDVLYLDPADRHSVWIYHHDGGDVERVAKTIGGWIRAAEPC